MMSATAPMPFAQFEQLPDDDRQHELLKGQHIVSLPDTIRRSNIRHALYELLDPFVKEHQLGTVFIAAGFLLSPDTFLLPACCFIRTAHLRRTDPNGYFEGSPALAIEIGSESITAAQLDLKMKQYVAHGAEEVWVVFPGTRRIEINSPDGRSRTATDVLESDLFPGWSTPVSTVFEV
jgi:Uma2 family endonuclease